MSGLSHFDDRVRSDEPGSAGNEYFHVFSQVIMVF